MIQREIVVALKYGLHARPACQLVALSMGFQSDLAMVYKNTTIDLKDLMLVACSNVNYGDKVFVQADGADEKEAMEKIEHLLLSEDI